METIIVGFSTTKHWHFIPWLIRKVSKTDFSHTYIRIVSKSLDRTLIYQASGTHLNFQNVSRFKQKHKIVAEFEIPVTPEEKKKILQYCIDTLGTPYGVKEFIGIGVALLAKWWFGIDMSNPWKDGEKTQICKELVGRVLKFLGYNADKDLESGGMESIYKLTQKVAADRNA